MKAIKDTLSKYVKLNQIKTRQSPFQKISHKKSTIESKLCAIFLEDECVDKLTVLSKNI